MQEFQNYKDSLGVFSDPLPEERKPRVKDSLGILETNVSTEKPAPKFKDSLGILSGMPQETTREPIPAAPATPEPQQSITDIANEIGAPIPEGVEQFTPEQFKAAGKALGKGVLQVAGAPGRLAADLSKPISYGQMAAGKAVEYVNPELGRPIIENAQKQIRDLNRIKENLTFVDEGLTDTALSFTIGGLAGAGTRALIEGSKPMAQLARLSGITEPLLVTGVKSGLVAAAGDKVIIDPALTVIERKVGETNLSPKTKELILLTAPLALGLLSGATIELKVDKLLKNPLAVGLFDDMARQGATPEEVLEQLPKTFDEMMPESLAKKPQTPQEPITAKPLQEPSATPESPAQVIREEIEPGIERITPVEKPRPKPRESQVRTLRGRIKQMGGINFLNFKGELREMPTAVKFLSRKAGVPIDLAEQELRDEGWLRQDESLLELFRDAEVLKRGRQDQIEDFSKPERELTDMERRVREEMQWEPESPPDGDYITMPVEALPQGRKLTIIEGDSLDGWDKYVVDKSDPFNIKLQDGETIEMRPLEKVQVLKVDLFGKPKAPKGGTTLHMHPSTITGPVGAISAGVDWKEFEETGEVKINPKAMFAGAVAGTALGAGYRPTRNILRKAATSWDKGVQEKLLDPLKNKVHGLIVNEDVRHALGMNRSKQFQDLMRDYTRDVERSWNKATEIGQAIQDVAPTRTQQKRLMQVIKGSVTGNAKMREAGEKINAMFAEYRQMLEDMDLLFYSRFDHLTRAERAKLRNIIAREKSERAMDEESFLHEYGISPDNNPPEYRVKGGEEPPAHATEEVPLEAYERGAKTPAEWARSKLWDHYHTGSAREYAPIFYKSKEGLTPHERQVLQDEIKALKIKSRRGSPEGDPVLEDMIYKLEAMLGTGWKARRAMRITRNELNKRYSHRRMEIPDEVQRIMGRIDEAAYPIARMAGTQSSDVIKARLFKEIANNSDWSKPKQAFQFEVPANWVKVADDRFGALDGMYVRKDIWSDLREIEEWRSAFVRNWDQMLGYWKYGKVVLNPATHARNFMSNLILAYMGDVNPGDVKTYGKAARAMAQGEKNTHFKEAADWGLFNNTFVSAEIAKFRDDLDRLQDGKALKSWFKKMAELPANLYQGNEKLFKMAVFLKAKEDGLSVDAAARKAEKFLFNYADIPPWVKHTKRWLSPFFTFTYKAVPLFAEMAIRKPWKIAALMGTMYGMERFANEKLGVTEEQAEGERKLLPAWQQRKVLGIGPYLHVKMPFQDKWGNSLYLDTAYILPYGNLGEKYGQSALPLSDLLPSNPIFNLGAEILTNTESFTGRPIYDELIDSQAQVLGKYLELAWRELTPSLAPGGYGFNKLKTGVKNTFFGGEEKDWAGREIELQTAILSSLLGIKLSPANEKKLKQFELGQMKRIRAAVRGERAALARKYKRNAISKEQYLKAVRQLADLEKRLIKERKP